MTFLKLFILFMLIYKVRFWESVTLKVVNLFKNVVLNALRLNNNFTKMPLSTSKLELKHFYSLLHPTDSNARLGRDVVILSLVT